MEEEELEVKFLDFDEYYDGLEGNSKRGELVVQWTNGFEESEKKWHKLLEKLHESLADTKTISLRIIDNYMRILAYSGVSVCLLRKKKPIDMMYLSLTKNALCLPMVLKRYAEVMEMENFVYFAKNVLAMRAVDTSRDPPPGNTNNVITLRLNEMTLFHQGYFAGVEKWLGISRLLRAFPSFKKTLKIKHPEAVYDRFEIFAFTSQATMMALQAVLEDWNGVLQGERILQLTHANALQLRRLTVQTDSLTVLSESLICAIAFGRLEDQEELEELDTVIMKKHMDREAKVRFSHWKTISNMMRNRANVNGCLVNAQRLEEEAVEIGGPECAILVEMACSARSLCENQNERIIEVITETVHRCPSLGPRMIRLADHCNVGYETDALLQALGDTDGLHPSDPTWILLIEKQISSFGKYGSVRKTLEKALKVMFEFLDFDANRFNEKAWHLLKKVLECTDPTLVAVEWDSRKGWWTKYQRSPARNRRKMGLEAEKVKMEVLQALDDYEHC